MENFCSAVLIGAVVEERPEIVEAVLVEEMEERLEEAVLVEEVEERLEEAV